MRWVTNPRPTTWRRLFEGPACSELARIWVLVDLTPFVAIAARAVTFLFISAVAPRFGHLAWPAWLGCVSLTFLRLSFKFEGQLLLATGIGVPTVLDVVVLRSVPTGPQPFTVQFAGRPLEYGCWASTPVPTQPGVFWRAGSQDACSAGI